MNILYVLQVLIGFGFVIAIHEAGHFFAAKRVGITCPAFSIGFPFPVPGKGGWKAYNIFRYKWRGTEYRLGWIPFGGYVTMQGQSDSPGQLEKAKEDDKGDYRNKSYWQKTQVLLGGVTMNAITAVIFFIIAFQVGVTFIEPTVGMVDQSSQAWVDNEIQVGDRILKVNGRDVVDFEDVVYAGIFDGGDSIDLVVEREEDGKTIQKNVTVKLDEDPTFGIKLPAIKAKHRVILTEEEAERFPEDLGEDRPREGDEILKVNGRVVRNAQDAQGFIEASRGVIKLDMQRGFDSDARRWEVSYTPRRKFYAEGSAYTAGATVLPAPWVDRVRKDGPAAKAGLQAGDRFAAVLGANGGEIKVNGFGDLTRLVDAAGGSPMALVVEREGKRKTVTITPEPRESRPGRYQLGVTVSPFPPDNDKSEEEQAAELNRTVVAYGVRPGSEAEKAGLQPGDKIVGVKVNGDSVVNEKTGEFDRLAYALALQKAAQADGPAEFTYEVERADGVQAISFKTDDEGPDSGAVMSIAAAEQRSAPVTYGLGESVVQGFYHSKKVGYKIIMTLAALFTGRVKVWHLGGPVVIAKRSYSLAQWGVGTLLFFLAFISINLAIVNMLPLPVLDGGQWLVVTIEAIRGKPLPEKAMSWVQLASFIFVVGLMLFVLGNDLWTVFIRKWQI
ncbi:MAG: site-2 protease family protein [Planctomycetes bacterium]|nr:site-2 protease family protein [Planctomycetota bacterium]MCB9936059.1 site-2 protease family protein [Planctomycetota bacterium]